VRTCGQTMQVTDRRNVFRLASCSCWAPAEPAQPEPAADRLGRRQLAPNTLPGLCNAATPGAIRRFRRMAEWQRDMYDTARVAAEHGNYGTTSILYYAAMSVNAQPGDGKGQWQNGRICGQCVEATAPTSQGLQSVIVRIYGQMP